MARFVLSIAAATLCFGSQCKAVLVAGDVAILGINTDTPDEFAWVPLVDLAPGTQIGFTDNGVLSSGSFRTGEGVLTYEAPSAIPAGTILTFTGTGGDYSAVSGSFSLSTSGDQVVAFTGTVASPNYLFIAQTNSTQFQTGSNDSNQSDLPPGLTVGTTAVAVGAGSGAESEVDNSAYNYIVTEGSRGQLLAAIANADNWNGSGSLIDPLVPSSTTALAVVPEPSVVVFGSLLATGLGLTIARRPQDRD